MREHEAEGHGEGHPHAHQAVPSDVALRVKALESLLVEKDVRIPSRWGSGRTRGRKRIAAHPMASR